MVDFSQLYQRPAGEAKRPPTLPGGDYPSIIRSYELIESAQKKTPGVRYFLTLLEWPANAPQEWDDTDEEGKHWHYTRDEIDLSKRQQRTDFYFWKDDATGQIADNALYQFDQFLRSCDVDPAGRSYEELIPAVVGHRVLTVMKQQLNQQTNRIFTTVDRIVGTK